MKKKIFVIDTSVLVHHEDAIHGFPEQELVIPMEVLEELDSLKVRHDSVGNAARYVHRFLDDLRSVGNLRDGVQLENGQTIRITMPMGLMPLLTHGDTMDNRIISAAFILNKEYDVTLISRDINMRVKCDGFGLKAENYSKEKAITLRKKAYTGVAVLEGVLKEDIDTFHRDGEVFIQDELEPNECVVLKNGESQSALGVADGEGFVRKLRYAGAKDFNCQGISPRSKEQVFAFEMLLDPDVSMVTITGMAGSGKTILATSSAIQMLNDRIYEKIIFSRPAQSMSKDIGFLPGLLKEKMAPWMQPFFDNLRVLFGKQGMSYIDRMFEKGVLEVEALGYVRGRTLPNTIFIIDEAQNISSEEAKAILTRMGENSKVILLGDLEQIDSPHLDSTNSGLAVIVERFKDFELSAHITLIKGERSKLATHAAKVL